jgi:hypothetical protein
MIVPTGQNVNHGCDWAQKNEKAGAAPLTLAGLAFRFRSARNQ